MGAKGRGFHTPERAWFSEPSTLPLWDICEEKKFKGWAHE
jgi:hypothetical protein